MEPEIFDTVSHEEEVHDVSWAKSDPKNKLRNAHQRAEAGKGSIYQSSPEFNSSPGNQEFYTGEQGDQWRGEKQVVRILLHWDTWMLTTEENESCGTVDRVKDWDTGDMVSNPTWPWELTGWGGSTHKTTS